jgi:hypothetical protein
MHAAKSVREGTTSVRLVMALKMHPRFSVARAVFVVTANTESPGAQISRRVRPLWRPPFPRSSLPTRAGPTQYPSR